MARIVSKSRKKPDIVVTPSNTSKTAISGKRGF